MKPKSGANSEKMAQAALQALRRAAKDATELARRTGTPAYVLENGRIIDVAKRRSRTRKRRVQA